MRLRVFFLLAAALAASGLVRADNQLRHRSTEPLRGADVAEQVWASLDQEERSLRAELDSIAVKESTVKRRMLSRGRAFYRLVRVGLLPVGGGFGSLLDHAAKMERARRALDQSMSDFRAIGDSKIALSHKLDDLATRKAPLELERQAAEKARALLGEAEDRRRAFDRAFESSTGAGDDVA